MVVFPHEIQDGPEGSSQVVDKDPRKEKVIDEVEETDTEEETFMGDLMADKNPGVHSKKRTRSSDI